MDFVRLPLEGGANVRDIGGYPTSDNKVTKFHVFVRSSRLTNLTTKDNEFLKEYGITDVIDLRGKSLIQDNFISDDNINKEYFNFHYIPLSTKKIEEYIKANEYADNFNFGIGYTYLLENKTKIKELFDVISSAKGGVLFHCTAGKDRTGIVTALILGLCGVDKKDIVANYEVTHTYVSECKFMDEYSLNMQISKPIFMDTFIQNLLDKYNSFEDYLLSCGISKENLEKIKNRLCN